jgi:RNA recognition motif-containing protein
VTKKLYVGNLPFSATEEEIEQTFGAHGTVTSVKLIRDRETGRSRGFAFVEMEEPGATDAMRALDGKAMGGRPLKVNEAQERERGGDRGPRGGGGGGGWGDRGDRGGDRDRGPRGPRRY